MPSSGEPVNFGEKAVREFDRIYRYLESETDLLESVPTLGALPSKKRKGLKYSVSRNCSYGKCAVVFASNDWLSLGIQVRDDGDGGVSVAKSPKIDLGIDSALEDAGEISLYERVAKEMGGHYSGKTKWGKRRLPTVRTPSGDFGIYRNEGSLTIYTGSKAEKKTALEREFIRAAVNSGEALGISVGPYRAQS